MEKNRKNNFDNKSSKKAMRDKVLDVIWYIIGILVMCYLSYGIIQRSTVTNGAVAALMLYGAAMGAAIVLLYVKIKSSDEEPKE